MEAPGENGQAPGDEDPVRQLSRKRAREAVEAHKLELEKRRKEEQAKLEDSLPVMNEAVDAVENPQVQIVPENRQQGRIPVEDDPDRQLSRQRAREAIEAYKLEKERKKKEEESGSIGGVENGKKDKDPLAEWKEEVSIAEYRVVRVVKMVPAAQNPRQRAREVVETERRKQWIDERFEKMIAHRVQQVKKIQKKRRNLKIQRGRQGLDDEKEDLVNEAATWADNEESD